MAVIIVKPGHKCTTKFLNKKSNKNNKQWKIILRVPYKNYAISNAFVFSQYRRYISFTPNNYRKYLETALMQP